MKIAILTPDGMTRLSTIVADLATARALNPGMLCVVAGTGEDLTASDPVAPPPPNTPAAISARQIRLALNSAGLRDVVEAAVAAGTRDLRDWWEFSTEVQRDHPMVMQMITALGVSPAQADDLWRMGATL
jgi:hypothetical protein